MNQVTNKYPENGVWNIFWEDYGTMSDNINDALTEVGGYIEADGKSLKKVKESCLKNGRDSGELWSIQYAG